MEYDVRFTSNWNYFFDAFEQSASDLLATTLYRYEFRPAWKHWPTLRSPELIPMEERVRGLFPIYRLSHDAIRTIDSAYRKGWAGHYEVTIPTILDQARMTLEDIGGNGSSVVLHELEFGLQSLPRGRRRDDLRQVLSDFITEFDDRILPLERIEAEWAARLRAEAHLSGRVLHLGDALIAGTAKAHGLSVATRNVKDFDGLDVNVANPWQTP